MKKYLSLLSRNIAIELEYKASIVTTILGTIISLLVFFVFWLVVYQSNETISGLTVSDTLLYYTLAVPVGFFTYVNISQQIGANIQSGTLSINLLRPINTWWTYFWIETGRKIAIITITMPVYLLVIVGISMWQKHNYFSVAGILATIVIVTFTFATLFVMDLILASLAFWMTDIWWVGHLKTFTFGVFAGASFPFEFLPQHLQGLFNFLPFKFAYYIPISYLQSKRDLSFLASDLVSLLLWGGFFLIIAKILWKKGLIKYDAYGN